MTDDPQPYRDLLAEVIRRAIEDVKRGPARAPNSRDDHQRRERLAEQTRDFHSALDFFLDPESHFAWMARALGLDPDEVRERVFAIARRHGVTVDVRGAA